MTTVYDKTWDLLEEALGEIRYTRDEPPGRRFHLVRDDESNYAVLFIFTYMQDSFGAPGEMRHTQHEFVVPVASYHKEAWTRWVFDRFMGIETHEACESFQVNGVRIYGPHHGNGEDPYAFWPGGTREQKRKHPGQD